MCLWITKTNQKIESIQQLLVFKSNKQVQVSIGDIFVHFISLIDSEKQLATITGISTFSVLEKIVELFSTNFPDTGTHHLSINVL